MRADGYGGVPLVLLHQSPHSSRVFDRLAPILARDRWVLRPDRLGFGQSDPLTRQLPFPAFAEATLEALDAVGVERFDMLGIHTGSLEAIEISAAYPGRVRRLMLIEIPMISAEEWAGWNAYVKVIPTPSRDGAHVIEAWNFHGREERPWETSLIDSIVVDDLAAGPHWRLLYPAIADYDVVARLECITQPTLVIAPRSSISGHTERALPHLGVHADVLRLPDHEAVELVYSGSALIAEHLRAWDAGQDAAGEALS
jgi:pimeloyl-ACP methyl ester carboxylesterase